MKVELVPGRGGVFDVEAGGTMVFSKHREQRFPIATEVIDRLRELG